MKNLFSLSIILLFFVCCKTQYDVVRKIDKEHSNSPPGTVWIKDSIYMDMCEVRNLDYLEYTLWVKKYDSINYNKVLPDTTVWRQKLSHNEPYVQYYFRHPAYRKYPVVGVSYEQVVDYCKWRTERVKEFAKLISPKSKYADSYKSYSYYYRLPTREEWECAAYAGKKDLPGHFSPYGFESLLSKENIPNFNVTEAYAFYGDGWSDILQPATYKNPNSFRLYNTIGNVAEMIINKGISKGGSWMNSISDCEISDSIKYESPSSWLGFRCVCVVTK